MSETQNTKETKTIPFYPDHLKTEAMVALGFMGIIVIIGIIAMFSPVGLEAPADPMVTPEHTKPEWYFLFLYEILKIDSIFGISIAPEVWVSIIMIAIVLFLLLPFFSKKTDNKKQMIIRAAASAVFMVFVIFFTIKGWIS